VALFYEKLLNDPLLAHFFEGVDMHKLAMKQVSTVHTSTKGARHA
jgi:truncated hemoglobin YjbI